MVSPSVQQGAQIQGFTSRASGRRAPPVSSPSWQVVATKDSIRTKDYTNPNMRRATVICVLCSTTVIHEHLQLERRKQRCS